MCKESLPGWYTRRIRVTVLQRLYPLGHLFRHSFMVLHTGTMHKHTIYSMYGGKNRLQEGRKFPRTKVGNIASKGMSKCGHVLGVLMRSLLM